MRKPTRIKKDALRAETRSRLTPYHRSIFSWWPWLTGLSPISLRTNTNNKHCKRQCAHCAGRQYKQHPKTLQKHVLKLLRRENYFRNKRRPKTTWIHLQRRDSKPTDLLSRKSSLSRRPFKPFNSLQNIKYHKST